MCLALMITAAKVLKDQVLMKNLLILMNFFFFFLANEMNKNEKMAQCVVFRLHVAPEEVFEQGQMIGHKISTKLK